MDDCEREGHVGISRRIILGRGGGGASVRLGATWHMNRASAGGPAADGASWVVLEDERSGEVVGLVVTWEKKKCVVGFQDKREKQ